MTNYPFKMQLVVDPDNPRNVVAGGSVSIYDSQDTAHTTLLALTDPSGVPIPNPITSNANGFTPPFVTTSPEVLWVSGGYTDYFQSYQGMRDEAVAAKAAAEAAGATAAAEAAAGVASVIADAAASATAAEAAADAAATAAALVGAPADAAVAAAINGAGTATKAALSATYASLTNLADMFATIGGAKILPRSNGVNDTAQLNAKLAAGGTFVTPLGENYKLDGPLIGPSNTHLIALGSTLTKLQSAKVNIGGVDYANCLMFINKNCFTGRFVQDGVVTAGGTNLQSATAAFTSADIGKKVRIWDAGDTTSSPAPHDTTITAIVDAQNATLATATPAAAPVAPVLGAPVHIGERDENIRITGGYWVRPYATTWQRNESWMYAHGIQTRHADRVTLTGLRHNTGGNKYMINLGEGTNLSVIDQDCQTASDGVHFTGPARTIVVENISGYFGDDTVAFCTGENAYGNGTGDTQGNIQDVRIENVTRSGNGGAAIKLAGSSYGYKHERFHVNGVTNLNQTGNCLAISISGDTGAPVTHNLHFKRLYGANLISSGTHGVMTFEDVRSDWLGNGVEIFNGATVTTLNVSGLRRKAGQAGAQGIYIYGSGVNVGTIHATDWDWNVAGSGILINTSATVGRIMLDGVIHDPGSSTGVMVSSQSSCTVGEIHAAGCRANGAFGFEIMNGTTNVTIGGGTYRQTFHVGSTGVVTVFGSWDQTSTGNQKDSGGVLRSYSPSWRCHINDLTADVVGLSATNRNSALSCGIGPVLLVAANKWQHAVTGAVYAPAGPSTVAAQAGAGTGATASLTGTDGAGSITVTTGTGPAAGAQVTFNCLTSWGAAPRSVVIAPTNAAAQAAGLYVSAKSATAFTVSAANAPAASTAMTFDFVARL